MERYRCPRCDSENIQSCPVIYQQGTVGHSYTTRSGDYSATTSGTESTALAQSVSPPEQKETHWIAMIITGVIALFAFMDGSMIAALIFGGITYAAYSVSQEASEYNDKQWPAEYKAWQNSYLCHRCGNIFVLN